MKRKLLYALLLLITLILIINPQKSVIYAQNGLMLCNSVIIPSLFPFFVCSGLLIYSGFCEILSKLMQPVMKPLFNINGSGSAAFVLGIISGYPLGALTACQLYEKSYLSKTETERLLAFCNNSGPLFILGAVGASLYHNPKIGVILYLSHILSAFLVGVIFRLYKRNDYNAPPAALKTQNEFSGEIFSVVLLNSIQSILTVCGAVVFFSAISGVFIDNLPLSQNIRSVVLGIFEFATGVDAISRLPASLFEKLILSAGVVGFAGFCVHIQVMGIVTKYQLSMIPYIIGKVMQGILSMLFTFLTLRFYPSAIQVFSNAADISASFAMNSLFTIISVVSITFISLSVLMFIIFKKRYEKFLQK